MQYLHQTGGRVPVMVNQSADFAASASLLQSATAIAKITGRKTRLDPRRAPSSPIVRQTRIHSRRRLCSRRRFGQAPSQQRPRPRQNDYPTRIVILNESASEGSLRQQLQVLRDLGLLAFLGSGSYRLR